MGSLHVVILLKEPRTVKELAEKFLNVGIGIEN
jgi:hypothetical protein